MYQKYGKRALDFVLSLGGLVCLSWLLLGLAGVAMMNGQTWLISAQRYALGMPALAPAAAVLTKRRWQRGALLAVLAVLWGVYFAAFAGHAPIY